MTMTVKHSICLKSPGSRVPPLLSLPLGIVHQLLLRRLLLRPTPARLLPSLPLPVQLVNPPPLQLHRFRVSTRLPCLLRLGSLPAAPPLLLPPVSFLLLLLPPASLLLLPPALLLLLPPTPLPLPPLVPHLPCARLLYPSELLQRQRLAGILCGAALLSRSTS
jgi:hypothetical protein